MSEWHRAEVIRGCLLNIYVEKTEAPSVKLIGTSEAWSKMCWVSHLSMFLLLTHSQRSLPVGVSHAVHGAFSQALSQGGKTTPWDGNPPQPSVIVVNN